MKNIFKRINAFTLAEVLITLAIIGVVAALAMPAVLSNVQQTEFRTGLRKAISVLNSAITLNIALEGETPYDNANLFSYLQRHMSILRSTYYLDKEYAVRIPSMGSEGGGIYHNAAFYTADGMRFEFRRWNNYETRPTLYESGIEPCYGSTITNVNDVGTLCGGCGSFGLKHNPDETTKPPCLISVDINGDRKPNPVNINCKDMNCATIPKYSDATGTHLSDMFTIIITDREAIPFGVAAQRAMYGGKK